MTAHTIEEVAPSVPTAPAPELALAGLGVLAVATLAGCGGGGGGGGDSEAAVPPANTITSITIREAADTALTVDGKASQTVSLPDPGSNGVEKEVSLVVRQAGAPALRAVGGPTMLTIRINPDPAGVVADYPTESATARATLAQLGFPPSWDELAAHGSSSATDIIARALARMSPTPQEAYPAWIDGRLLSWQELQQLSAEERDAYQDRKYPRRQEFKGWWFRQMVTSSDTLTERLLLFWHNLYTTSASGVDDPELIARQHRLYRTHLNGNLKTFLYAMSRDPAMCQYLDSARNYKDAPNENFARELMELFTLGERNQYGGYAESDVADLAKFFTGYHLDNHQAFAFDPDEHQTVGLTLFGQSRTSDPVDATQDGDWAIDQILAKKDGSNHSYAARYLVTRLWREFLGQPTGTPDTDRIQVIADLLCGTFNWNLAQLYQEFFASPAFSDPARRGHRVRSPVELYVGFYRPLGLRPNAWTDQLWTCYSLDQDILDPPNVFGWPGGANWINLKTVVDRRQFLSWLQWDDGTKPLPLTDLPLRLHGVIKLLLLAIDPVDPPIASNHWSFGFINYQVGHLLTDPAYNVG